MYKFVDLQFITRRNMQEKSSVSNLECIYHNMLWTVTLLRGSAIKYAARSIACCDKIHKESMCRLCMKIENPSSDLNVCSFSSKANSTTWKQRITTYSYRGLSILFSFIQCVFYFCSRPRHWPCFASRYTRYTATRDTNTVCLYLHRVRGRCSPVQGKASYCNISYNVVTGMRFGCY